MQVFDRYRNEGFQCAIRWASGRALTIVYVGYVWSGGRHVQQTEEMVLSSGTRVGLCYDLRELRGFHHSQVGLHAQALTRLADRVAGIALVGARPAARFAAVTASLVARLPLATFDEPEEAVAWLESLR
jgi:hypothetical protein